MISYLDWLNVNTRPFGSIPTQVGASGSHKHPVMRLVSSRTSPSHSWQTMNESMPMVITVRFLAVGVCVVGLVVGRVF